MKTFYTLLFALLLTGCEPADDTNALPFVAGFERESYKYSDDATQEITLVFSKPAEAAGTVVLRMTPDQCQYGVDYATSPEADGDLLSLPFSAGQNRVSFTYHNLMLPYDDADLAKTVRFEVVRLDYAGFSDIQGYTLTQMTFGASLGAIQLAEVGGPNQGDQVYIDLSTEMATHARRDSWDLGFFGGDHFRVVINGSVYMAARNLNVTDIDAVNQAGVSAFQNQVAVGTFDPENENYIDAPNGNILQTAIEAVSANEQDNKVYLVNLGYKVGTMVPPAGSVAITGDARGWKKIRVLRDGEGYRLQYADLNSTTHHEVSIPKNATYNFSFFSFDTNQAVSVEPEKNKWDLCFTVFTNTIDGAGSYGYSDFVLNNLKAGVRAYRINVTPSVTFANFTKAGVNQALFENDQRVIGADWRDVFSGTAYANRFYVLKDADGNYYKIRMLGFLSEGGLRGYPKFEYKLLP